MTILLLALSGMLLGGAVSMRRQGAATHIVALLGAASLLAFVAGALRL